MFNIGRPCVGGRWDGSRARGPWREIGTRLDGSIGRKIDPYLDGARSVTEKRDVYSEGARGVTEKRDVYSEGARTVTEKRDIYSEGA